MPTDRLSETFAALADPTRRAILARLGRARSAQSRPSSLQLEPLEHATAWTQARRVTWERRMDRLDKHLDEIQEGRER